MNKHPRDTGAVAITVAILAFVLIGLAAFTLDFGMAYAQRRALSTGADSAALAIVRENYNKVIKDPSLTCSQLLASGETAAQTTALTQVNSNKPFGTTLPASSIQTPVLSCVGAESGILQATVTVSKTVDTIFGNIFGVSTLPISRSAAAALGAVNEVSGYIPIALCKDQADKILANAVKDANAVPAVVGRHELILIDKKWKGSDPCNTLGVAEGNWGWLYCSTNGASDLADTIANGCPQPLVIVPGSAGPPVVPDSVSMKGSPGNKGQSSQISDALASLMDTSVAIPVYDAFNCDKANCRAAGTTPSTG